MQYIEVAWVHTPHKQTDMQSRLRSKVCTEDRDITQGLLISCKHATACGNVREGRTQRGR